VKIQFSGDLPKSHEVLTTLRVPLPPWIGTHRHRIQDDHTGRGNIRRKVLKGFMIQE